MTKQEEHIVEKMKLLLVDDEERYLKTTRRLMEKKGYSVAVASSGSGGVGNTSKTNHSCGDSGCQDARHGRQ